MLKLIHRNKTKFGLVFLLIILIIASLFILTLKNDEDSDLANEYKQTQSSELPPSGLDPSLLVDLNKLIRDMKLSEAKAMIDRLNEDGLTHGDKLMLNSSKLYICNQLHDLACLDKVIKFNKDNEQDNLHVYLAAGIIAENKKLEEEKKAYYREAMTLIDSRGGQKYVESINNSSQSDLSYDKIKLGAE